MDKKMNEQGVRLFDFPFNGELNSIGTSSSNHAPNPSMLGEYMVDAFQRHILFLDVMRERGNQFNDRDKKSLPSVLDYDYEVVVDGETFSRPVNYKLLKITPPEGVIIDPLKKPIVIFDPRAGHGPGISGFKADSEVGVGFKNGHACYVVAFTPEPVKGQTIEDIMKAEVAFVEEVIRLHPECGHRPILVGNCQGGWALMMMASYRPDLCGPIVVAGSPLSYWAGVHGKNPMRYSGGFLGGTWLTRLTSDLGDGIFDGAWLVANFEGMNPGNTLWSKQYNLYEGVDTEKERYLKFEDYWGGYSLLNGEEMQFIVDNLFVGNKLSKTEVVTSDGVPIDFRNIKAPILCFCSDGDNITPPQQALGWILDLYDSVEDIQSFGQTIVYCVHEDVGHLGIFVSGQVSRKEQSEFASNIDYIDMLPPGLYEAVLIDDKSKLNQGLEEKEYFTRFEPRNLDDIRKLGHNDENDERCFAAVRRMSEINNQLYTSFLQPFVRASVTSFGAAFSREIHPNRLIYRLFSDENPWMAAIASQAEYVRENRTECQPDNLFVSVQKENSKAITQGFNTLQKWRDKQIEDVFLGFFGNPFVQTALGVSQGSESCRPKPTRDPKFKARVDEEIKRLKANISEGGELEAFVRSVIYVNLPSGAADERSFIVLEKLIEKRGVSFETMKAVFREQYFMLLLDKDAAIAALPQMLPSAKVREQVLKELAAVTSASGQLNDVQVRLLGELQEILV